MSLQSFENMMTHTVDLVKQTKDYTGSLSDQTTYADEKAFVQYGSKRMVDRGGEEITVAAIVFLPSGSNYDSDHPYWRVVHGNRNMKVDAPEVIDDPRSGNTHHYELGVR